jgi:diguanylate cyclase (GGDEF)-like protein
MMILTIARNLLGDNVKILKSEATKAAYQGILIAVAAIVIATFMVSFFSTGELSLEGIVAAQKNNMALWVLDCIPFVFSFWGQYSSTMIVYQAGAMVFDQTQELRSKADNLEKQASYVSTHDPLTDLPNIALFYDRVEQAIFSADAQNQLIFVLLIEIENFKDVYDTLGRSSSDLVLKQTSARLKGVSRERDAIAKIDSNVFGFLSTSIVSLTIVERLAQAIQQVMEPPFIINRLKVSVHTNIGITYFPDHGDDVDTLVQRAGVALHMAQLSSKGYCIYEPSFDKYSPKRLTLISELRNAIKRDQLELFYQAKVSIQTGRISGAEALVRWNHLTHGAISPDEFIPMAEHTRNIKHVTFWVLQRAFRNCAAWHEQGIDIKISVNLSSKDLHDPELPDLIAGVAAAAAVKPEWIMLEITEGSVMNDPESALEIMERLHAMGYQFAIDDFGTGYSSLAYLRKMPLTELKIDRSFIMDIMSNENDAIIVKATINLAHNLGFQITAEGVESKEIMAKIKDYGCDMAQGYYLSKPLSVADFTQWMSAYEWHD